MKVKTLMAVEVKGKSAKNPVEKHPANTEIDVSAEVGESLIKAGAAIEVSDTAPAKKAAKKKAPAKKADTTTEGEGGEGAGGEGDDDDGEGAGGEGDDDDQGDLGI